MRSLLRSWRALSAGAPLERGAVPTVCAAPSAIRSAAAAASASTRLASALRTEPSIKVVHVLTRSGDYALASARNTGDEALLRPAHAPALRAVDSRRRIYYVRLATVHRA